MSLSRKITIAGAGLGGLAAAACLLLDGHDVEVYEQAEHICEVGAGIQVSDNAMHVIRHLGLGDEIARQAVRPEAYTFCMADTGEVVQSFELSDAHERAHGAPYYHVHRADLHDILAERVNALKPGCIRVAHRLVAYEEDADGVTAIFENGARVRSDMLIGSDGLKSVVRRQMKGDDNPIYTGDLAWRIIVPAAPLRQFFPRIQQTLWMASGGHAVSYFVRNAELLNFVGIVEKEKASEESWTLRRPWEEFKADFAGWNPAVQALIDCVDKDACYVWALHIREPVPDWSTARVTLLGDAIHATLPYLAQGAAMAMEDGAVLMRALRQSDDIAGALNLYERNRFERTARVVRESSANGKLFHHRSRQAIYDAFSKRDMGAERSSWLFNYNPLTVELT
ncbi:MAG: FAD-dependent monooxygenase [Hyphomicrobiales bacterium]|nr:FAD-dependent monooxygenase [Hyphomicrobiales bacterium]